MKQLTDIYSNNPNKKKEPHSTKFQLDEIISKQKQYLIQQLKYNNYENSNKPNKYFASQLQCKKDKAIISTHR